MTLARELNEKGIKATYVDKWSAEALRDMLLRPSVAGSASTVARRSARLSGIRSCLRISGGRS